MVLCQWYKLHLRWVRCKCQKFCIDILEVMCVASNSHCWPLVESVISSRQFSFCKYAIFRTIWFWKLFSWHIYKVWNSLSAKFVQNPILNSSCSPPNAIAALFWRYNGRLFSTKCRCVNILLFFRQPVWNTLSDILSWQNAFCWNKILLFGHSTWN